MMDERMTESERATLCRRIDELCAENERLRQENQSIGMAAYDFGYRNGSVHYELEHCPACKNIADLQEALEENAKLRELAKCMAKVLRIGSGWCNRDCADEFDCDFHECPIEAFMRELGIEVDE